MNHCTCLAHCEEAAAAAEVVSTPAVHREVRQTAGLILGLFVQNVQRLVTACTDIEFCYEPGTRFNSCLSWNDI